MTNSSFWGGVRSVVTRHIFWCRDNLSLGTRSFNRPTNEQSSRLRKEQNKKLDKYSQSGTSLIDLIFSLKEAKREEMSYYTTTQSRSPEWFGRVPRTNWVTKLLHSIMKANWEGATGPTSPAHFPPVTRLLESSYHNFWPSEKSYSCNSHHLFATGQMNPFTRPHTSHSEFLISSGKWVNRGRTTLKATNAWWEANLTSGRERSMLMIHL